MNTRVGIYLAVLIVVLASCSGAGINQTGKLASSTDFGTSWNTHCSDNNFVKNSAATSTTTLGDMYFGDDFAKDIGLMDNAISKDLGEVSGLSGASEIELYGWFDVIGDSV